MGATVTTGLFGNRNTPVSVAHAIVRALEDRGVTIVFGVPGGPISPITDALIDSGIEFVATQQETMAVHAAGGYWEATGIPGVVLVTSGPGILSAVTGLASAHADHRAVVVLAGEVPTQNSGAGVLQDGSQQGLDIHHVVKTVVKHSDVITEPSRAAAAIHRAFCSAVELPCGPSVVRIPLDMSKKLCATGKLSMSPRSVAPPSTELCQAVGALLSRAKRPAMLVGAAARRGNTYKACIDLAEWAHCPVFTDIEAKGVFPETHPLSLGIFGAGGHGRVGEYLQGGIDLLICVGARLCDVTTGNFSPMLTPEGCTVVQLDDAPSHLAQRIAPGIAVAGELRQALELITKHTSVSAQALVSRDHTLRTLTAPVSTPKRSQPGSSSAPFDPRDSLAELQACLPADTVFVSDIGNHLLFASHTLRLDRPDQFYMSMGLGAMGSGLGMAIGLQLALGDTRRVVAIVGDGGLLMHGTELATCARYDIPLTIVALNDGQLGMVAQGAQRVYGRSHDWSTPVADLRGFSESLGLRSHTLTGLGDLRPAVASWTRKPLFLDIPVNGNIVLENPRDDLFEKETTHWESEAKPAPSGGRRNRRLSVAGGA